MNQRNRQKSFVAILGTVLLWISGSYTFSQVPADDAGKFLDSVKKRLAVAAANGDKGPARSGLKFQDVCLIDDDRIAKTVFTAYGSMFVVTEDARVPTQCVFTGERDVQDFQKSTKYTSTVIDGVTIELQESAMNALLKAIREASENNLSISPLDGSTAARRSYADTVRIWNSRFLPALTYWTGKGRLRPEEAEAAKAMDIRSQITQVLDWENRGLFFSTDKSKSILYATAPPGTSQHISMLAFDVVNYQNKKIREILAENGWYQTIVTDHPHFTYLGRTPDELAKLGLKKIRKGGYVFWVPGL